MIPYPTSIIFRVVHTIQNGLESLKNGKPTRSASITMDEFMKIVDLPFWASIEEKFEGKDT